MTANGSVLVTGGAGYIGSHVLLSLREAGYRTVALDDLSTGRRDAVPDDTPFVESDAGDAETIARIVAEHGVGAVIHLAGPCIVPESVVDPLRYYRGNTAAGLNLIRACIESGVGRFVFSSTAAVYGVPAGAAPVGEDAPTAPINPYGNSKLAVEWALRDTATAHDGFRYAALRYFNVAGADPHGRAGQSTRQATHLVKVAVEAALGRRGQVTVFGADYDTPDGTCVRDYIHVSDLAELHVAALRRVEDGDGDRGLVLNCGYGRGFSVREVLAAVQAEAGAALDVRDGPRRDGDPPRLVSDVSRLRAALPAWTPRHDRLDHIVRTALAWEERLAGGRPEEEGAPPPAAAPVLETARAPQAEEAVRAA